MTHPTKSSFRRLIDSLVRSSAARSWQSPSALANVPNGDEFDVERLEDRALLTGLVNIAVQATGELVLTGDAQSNEVFVTSNKAGDLWVEGRSGTQLKWEGHTAAQHVITLIEPHVLPSLKANLAGGDDNLELQSLEILGRATVNLSQGDDILRLSNLEVGGDTSILGGGGRDLVEAFVSQFHGSLSVNVGSQAGTHDFHGVTLKYVAVSGNLTLRGSAGENHFACDELGVEGNTQFKTGGGADQLILENCFFLGNANFTTSGGDDDVEIEGSQFFAATFFKLGGGDDVIAAYPQVGFAGPVTFHGGGGSDILFGFAPNFTAGPPSITSMELVFLV